VPTLLGLYIARQLFQLLQGYARHLENAFDDAPAHDSDDSEFFQPDICRISSMRRTVYLALEISFQLARLWFDLTDTGFIARAMTAKLVNF